MKMRFVKDFEDEEANFTRLKKDLIFIETIEDFYKIELKEGVQRWLSTTFFRYENKDINFVFFNKDYHYFDPSSDRKELPIYTYERKEILGYRTNHCKTKEGDDWILIPLEYLEFVLEDDE